MVNPYVLIATHNRLSITKKNIECLLACDVGVILVCSDRGEFDLFAQLFPTVIVGLISNHPLGKKWQYGVDMAKQVKADPLIINGSDDILSPKFFEEVKNAMEEEFNFVGLASWYVYDMKHVHHFDYLAPIPLGGGRAYSRKLLEKIEYKLFDTKKDRHLDDLGYQNARNSGMKIKLIKKPLILSVKGDWPCMNPANKMFGSINARLIDSIYNPLHILQKFNYEG